MWDFLRQFDRIRDQLYDKPCERCGTIIAFSEGVAACPMCHQVSEKELIEVHIKQAKEKDKVKKLGLIFIAISFVLSLFFYLAIDY